MIPRPLNHEPIVPPQPQGGLQININNFRWLKLSFAVKNRVWVPAWWKIPAELSTWNHLRLDWRCRRRRRRRRWRRCQRPGFELFSGVSFMAFWWDEQQTLAFYESSHDQSNLPSPMKVGSALTESNYSEYMMLARLQVFRNEEIMK